MVSFGVFASKLFGSSNERKLKSYDANVAAINALEGAQQAFATSPGRRAGSSG